MAADVAVSLTKVNKMRKNNAANRFFLVNSVEQALLHHLDLTNRLLEKIESKMSSIPSNESPSILERRNKHVKMVCDHQGLP